MPEHPEHPRRCCWCGEINTGPFAWFCEACDGWLKKVLAARG